MNEREDVYDEITLSTII